MLKVSTDLVAAKAAAMPAPKLHYVEKTIKGDTFLVLAQSQIELEDEFSSQGLYYTATEHSNIFLEPPFNPTYLLNLVQSNNILNQCVSAMETNIDGTGFEFEKADPDVEKDEDEEATAKSFFGEPCPSESFTTIRRRLRQQMESIGYGYLEVLRNLGGDVVGLRNVETHNVRMVKLDGPILVKKKVSRDGNDVELNMWVRERRFAQRVALKTLVYYREFGATREINRNNGAWAADGETIAIENRGTELLMFGVTPDVTTPYFLPRWINELPSVIGGRKAEEQNLEFLDSGGIPSALIFVQGGVLAKDAADQLRMYLSGQNKNKNRAVVVEAQSSSGSLDAAGNVQVKVERFGASQALDSMYGKYDDSTGAHIRMGFRLPPLFLGEPADFNYATAVVAYMVAEAQVFQPERAAFDELINMTILKALNLKTIKFQSNAITLRDPSNQMASLTLAKDMATRESFLKEINELTGFDLELAPEPLPDTVSSTVTVDPVTGEQQMNTAGGRVIPGAIKPPAAPNPLRGETQKPQFAAGTPKLALPSGGAKAAVRPAAAGVPGKDPAPKRSKAAMDLIDLAHDFAISRGLVRKRELSADRMLLLEEAVNSLSETDLEAFNTLVAQYTFGSDMPDLVGITRRMR